MKEQSAKIAAVVSSEIKKDLLPLSEHIYYLEIRGDRVIDFPKIIVKNQQLIYSIRSKKYGGEYDESLEKRHNRLLNANLFYDLIELEADKDLSKKILESIPAEKRIISWYGPSKSLQELHKIKSQLGKVPAKYYKIVPRADKSGDELAPLRFLNQSKEENLIVYSSGPIGLWTQIVSIYLGSALIYANTNEEAKHHFSFAQLINDYRFPSIRSIQFLYGIVGNPVLKSLSPRLHNNTHLQNNFPGLFVPFHVESYNDFWRNITKSDELQTLGLELKGLTTVSPFKEDALKKSDISQNPLNETIESCNVVFNAEQHWIADTTDYYGVSTGLKELGIPIGNSRIAVIGCGGAGRTIAAGLLSSGADVFLVNRSENRGLEAAKLLGVEFQSLSNFSPSGFKVVINATPMGKLPITLPFDPCLLDNEAVVIDMAYGNKETLLVKKCKELGIQFISGRLMLVLQVRRQYELMTGLEMPLDLAERLAGTMKQKELIEQ